MTPSPTLLKEAVAELQKLVGGAGAGHLAAVVSAPEPKGSLAHRIAPLRSLAPRARDNGQHLGVNGEVAHGSYRSLERS